jgi:hypothetical protein
MQEPKLSDTERVIESNVCIAPQCTLNRRIHSHVRNPHVRTRCKSRGVIRWRALASQDRMGVLKLQLRDRTQSALAEAA